MKRLLCVALTAVIALTFAGCSKTDKESPKKDNSPSIEDKTDKNKSEDDKNSKEKDKTDLEKNNDALSTPPDDKNESESVVTPPTPDAEPVPTPTPPAPDTTERVFKIYSQNHNLEIVDGGEIRTIELGVAENIREILSTVSSQYFDGAAIELSTIDTINDKKIAVINLIDNGDYWYQSMQGSTGGQMTEYNLIENVLQRQYPGYWVDGVRFTLNGQNIVNSEHCPDLSKTTYR